MKTVREKGGKIKRFLLLLRNVAIKRKCILFHISNKKQKSIKYNSNECTPVIFVQINLEILTYNKAIYLKAFLED